MKNRQVTNEFEKAKLGTKEFQVWQKALDSSKREDLLREDVHIETLLDRMTEVMKGKKVAILLSKSTVGTG